MKKLLLIGILLTLIGCSKDYSKINTGVEGVKYEFTYDNGKDNIEVTKSVYGCLKNCEVVVEFELQNLLGQTEIILCQLGIGRRQRNNLLSKEFSVHI